MLVAFKLKMYLAAVAVVLLGLALAVAAANAVFGVQIGPSLVTAILLFLFTFSLFQWLFGPYLINAMYRAYEVRPNDPNYGWLVQLVHEVALRNGLTPPKVYIADVPFPNAFAYGSPIAGKRVAITLPLLRILNRDELKAVLGHEVGHLRHHDVELLMAIGLIPSLVYYLGWSLLWGGDNRNGNGSLIGLALVAVSFVFNLFVLYINRLREAYADINSALTVEGGARNLQLALAKIVLATNPKALEAYKKKANTLSMLFFNSVVQEVRVSDAHELVEAWKRAKVSPLEELFSTHPHPARRVQMLERFARG